MDQTLVQSAPSTAHRFGLLDCVRGLALCLMIVYHAAWDAVQFGLVVWTPERQTILSTTAPFIAGSFLVISGASLAFQARRSTAGILKERGFWRRLMILVIAACAVSIATFFALPEAPIYFGILHHIALASMVIALLAPFHAFVAASAAAFVVILNGFIANPVLNHPALIWLGLGTQPPVTADWVPAFPWLAAGLLGFSIAARWLIPTLEGREYPLPAGPLWLQFMGRHSLVIYLIHQPILIGSVIALRQVFGVIA
ncbi:MAG: heparan-alpha-glucosaminide N-acetyltransferase [Pseudomonadota bacterium]